MNIGKQIKKYREIKNISQEELADKIFVTRQTISNWENDKNYPDIKSICLLCNFFNVSLDIFIKGDIEEMKKIINETDRKGFIRLSRIYSIELIIMIVSAYPLLKFAGIIGVAVWLLFTIVTIVTAFEIEKIKKAYDVQTYKEIVAFYENKSLNHDEKIEEKAKIPYQKFLLSILSAIIAIIVFVLLEVLIG